VRRTKVLRQRSYESVSRALCSSFRRQRGNDARDAAQLPFRFESSIDSAYNAARLRDATWPHHSATRLQSRSCFDAALAIERSIDAACSIELAIAESPAL